MKFICLHFKNKKKYYNLNELRWLNLLPLHGKELEYGEIEFCDGESFCVNFSNEIADEFDEMIIFDRTFVSLVVIEDEEDEE